MSTPISELRLERLAAGDLPAAEEAALRAALQGDPVARQRLAEIERSTPALLADYPADSVHDEVMRRVRLADETSPQPRSRLSAAFVAWPAAAAVVSIAVGLFVVQPWRSEPQPTRARGAVGEGTPGERTKGLQPGLVLHRVTGGQAERLASGAEVRAGERLQVSLRHAAERHAVVVSVDGSGQVTLHYPRPGDPPIPREPPLFNLPRSYELDAAPSFECFLLLTSLQPLHPQDVVRATREAAARGGRVCQQPHLKGLPANVRRAAVLLTKPG